ncbi:hypothetical protein E1262_07375 [Jiangella aurantiaca]|uniref:Polysaccharide chain length determinant N-terminal domain-containing protein n=1 Tax=Jiangella aurantiaca TaxID=2530373 RepID=A0A4R5AH03_9ACTN|nr:hypothetical protein [Jiangella aurantiaca]TDD70945.1 hypothetical protein E1262_07375 [Jiangella aurantiaca]
MSDFLAAAGRRWYVLVLGVLLTAGLGVGAAALSPPTYSARGLVLLLPPEEAVGAGGNPFLALGALDMPARIIVSFLDSPSARAGIEEAVPSVDYEVAMEEATRGPVIAIEVTASTPGGAMTALQDIAEAVPNTLARLQLELDVPAASAVTSMPLTMSTEAVKDTGGTTRAVVVAIGTGLAATVVATLSTDRLALRRAARWRAMPRSRGDTRPAGGDGPSGAAGQAGDAGTVAADSPRRAPAARRRAR